MKSVDIMSNKERIEYLLLRYSEEKATLEELEELNSRLKNPLEEQLANEWLYSQLQQSDSYSTEFDHKRLESILQRIHHGEAEEVQAQPEKQVWIRRWWPAVAAVLILAFTGTYKLISKPKGQNSPTKDLARVQIQPGHSGAVLHLSNGRQILLDSLQNGTLTAQQNVQVIKKNGELEYKGRTDKVIYNTITTNRGRQWQLTLSDGTRVWLNSESSIHYPLSFNGNERTVEVTGEAYFEVAHNDAQPFKVLVKNQVIEDLGTTFNINAYHANVTTTLLTGSLRVHLGDRSALLKPGQQAAVNRTIHLRYGVNTEAITAWKSGLFQFDNADLQTVLEQIARWYNVGVSFKGQPGNRAFSGKIPKDMNLDDVLKILQQLSVHFEIRPEKPGSDLAGRIIVTP